MTDAHDISERYELVERIAVGGMAEVFRAKRYGSHGFAKQMAVKRILPSLASDEEFVTRFIAEAKISVTLSHANIVQVFDFSRFGESLYIAMEYVEGADLSHLLGRFRQAGEVVGVAASMFIAIELLKGLDFAHRKGIVHRDISPSNVLVSRAGEVKITDFGIAQAAGLELTRNHRVMGKWPYMSPEQTRGDELDARTDLFSAGVVVYELLTGVRLFRGNNVDEIRAAINEGSIAPPSSLRPPIPGALDEVVLRLLDRDRDARGSAASALDALVEVSYQSAVQATSAALIAEVERMVPPRAPDETGSAQLLDDIINSELEHARAHVGRDTRVTLEATGLGPVQMGGSGDGAPTTTSVGMPTHTAMTFIKSSVSSGGLSEWLVSDASGTYALKRTKPLYAVRDAGAEVKPTPAGERAEPAASLSSPGEAAVPTLPAEHAPGDPPARRRRRLVLALSLVALAAIAVVAAIGVIAARRGDRPGARSGEGSGERLDAALSASDDASATSAVTDARLELVTTPSGARVFLEGRDIGVTPLSIDHPGVAARVELHAEGYESCTRETSARTSETIRCTLTPERARLTVLSTPAGARVFVGDELVGTTPLRDLELPAAGGGSEVTIVKDGYRTASQRVALTAGSSARVQKELEAEAETGRIDIDSEPWANIYFRGKKVGVAPVRGLVLPAGEHRLTLVNPEKNRRTTLTVTIPGPRRYNVVLP